MSVKLGTDKGYSLTMSTMLKKVIRKLKESHVELAKGRKCVSLKPKGPSRGNVLLSTDTREFLRSKQREDPSGWHSFAWENIQQANTFLDLGYCVDVIDYDNSQFSPKKEYAFFLDVLANLEILSPKLNESCVKIFYPVWSHWVFHNKALYDRLLSIQDRKGVTLKPRRILKPNFSIEHADYIVQRGNRYTASTYDYAGKPTYFVRHSSTVSYPFNPDKPYETGRKRYLWLGSQGALRRRLQKCDIRNH